MSDSGWDAALALPCCLPEGRLCDFSRYAKGAWRQHRDFRLRHFGFRDIFHTERVASRLSQRALEKGQGRSNGQTLLGMGRIPSDNYIRDRLDEADPALLQPCFERMETLLDEPRCGRRSVGWAAEL
jgi:hypothetical protein